MFELDKYANTVLTAYAVSMILLGVLIWLTLSKSKKTNIPKNWDGKSTWRILDIINNM